MLCSASINLAVSGCSPAHHNLHTFACGATQFYWTQQTFHVLPSIALLANILLVASVDTTARFFSSYFCSKMCHEKYLTCPAWHTPMGNTGHFPGSTPLFLLHPITSPIMSASKYVCMHANDSVLYDTIQSSDDHFHSITSFSRFWILSEVGQTNIIFTKLTTFPNSPFFLYSANDASLQRVSKI